ncbi:MAG: hypothetical protein AAF329_06470 [Cyanobacteria bacterium P01_A01_bin.17]
MKADKRVHQIKVLFNDAEWEQLLTLCATSGLKPGTYCRLQALEQTARVVPVLPEVMGLRGDLGRYGNNVNQVARNLNAGNVMDTVDALRVEQSNRYVGDRIAELLARLEP